MAYLCEAPLGKQGAAVMRHDLRQGPLVQRHGFGRHRHFHSTRFQSPARDRCFDVKWKKDGIDSEGQFGDESSLFGRTLAFSKILVDFTERFGDSVGQTTYGPGATQTKNFFESRVSATH